MQLLGRIRHSAETHTPAMIVAWPAAIGVFTLAIFAILWMRTTPAFAVVGAAITLAAGGLLLTLLYGLSWITQVRPALSGLMRRPR
ncbi:MAG: hypothetical protein GEV11_19765 [Streptosporangiales bacterium]|nr:hypothetical protein [Streptosporangiales bacterium]